MLMLVSWLCHKRWTQIFQFFSMRMWSSTYTMHTRSLNFSIDCLSNLRFFFHLLCRAVPLFRSALFGPYTQSILNDTQTEKEKEMVEKAEKKINSFNKHPAQCSDLCELFAYFIRYCLFLLTRSLFKQFTVVHIIFVVYAIYHLVLHQIPGHRIL